MAKVLIKQINTLANGFSFLFSSFAGKPIMAGLPPALGIEVTNYCNLHCIECPSGSGLMKRDKGFMNPDLYERILAELSPYLYNINLFLQGEPMIHPGFFKFIEASGNMHLVVSTNGHFLTSQNVIKIADSKLKKLIVSIDGMDEDTYSAYRAGGQLGIVMDGIRNVSEAIKHNNSSLKLELQFLVHSKNENQIQALRLFAKEVNASVKLKSMQILNACEAGKWLPVDGKYRRYKEEGSSFIIKNSLPDRCFRLWTNPVITWDGKVLPCCFDKDADHIMGDLEINSFREIWFGEKFAEFRQAVIHKRSSIKICCNCTSGMKGVKV
jgi:radical SAM protein with 4Fe4S-binding SPASM domain